MADSNEPKSLTRDDDDIAIAGQWKYRQQSQSLTRDELAEMTIRPFVQRMEAMGLTEDYLITRTKEALNAKQPGRIKVRGMVDPGSLGKGAKIVAASEQEAVIEWNDPAWTVRSDAIKNAHKLRGDYPAERMEHLGKDGKSLALIEKVVFEIVQAPAKDENA